MLTWCILYSIHMQGLSCLLISGIKHFQTEVSMPANFNLLNLFAEGLLVSSEKCGDCIRVSRKCWFWPSVFHCSREHSRLYLTCRMTYPSVVQEIPWQAVPARGWEWQQQPKRRRVIERWGREYSATALKGHWTWSVLYVTMSKLSPHGMAVSWHTDIIVMEGTAYSKSSSGGG